MIDAVNSYFVSSPKTILRIILNRDPLISILNFEGFALNREDAVWLLKQVMAACPSFSSASAVSITKEGDGWVLSAYWVPGASDEDCLEKIVTEYGLEVITSKGRTVFRSTKKLH